MALASVGSLSRDEPGPCSDADLVLLHTAGATGAERLAERLWYPLWDGGLTFDHAVRTTAACLDLAARDLTAAIGLLDLRRVAGDHELVVATRQAVVESWRSSLPARLDALTQDLADRARRTGHAAHLLEPDLKHARGGLRDVTVLRALAIGWLVDRPGPDVVDAHRLLLDVRDAAHVVARRPVDRLLLTEVDEVAALLDRPADPLRREISWSARRIAHRLDVALRSAVDARPRRGIRGPRAPRVTRAGHGLVVHEAADGRREVALDLGADPGDPVTALRAGALAARHGLALSTVTAARLGAHATPMPVPWPAAARTALIDLLAGGSRLLPVWESLDLTGCIATWIPAWRNLQALPQHHPLHRHTVDRHSLETVVQAHPLLGAAGRPDLLVLAALLHDIGKGTIDNGTAGGPDHPAAGAPIAAGVVRSLGYDEADTAVVERLVRHHLTLAALATRRDHEDPVTLRTLLDAVHHDARVLTLLRLLTEADARAAGPAAWSHWRARLINDLADRASASLNPTPRRRLPFLATDPEPVRSAPRRPVATDRSARVHYRQLPDGVEIVIAAADRPSLFADLALVLVRHRVGVRSIAWRRQEHGAAEEVTAAMVTCTWHVDVERVDDLPDPAYLSTVLDRPGSAAGDLPAGVRRRLSAPADPPAVAVLTEASDTAAVIEVGAPDRAGLLYAVGTAFAACRLTVRSAHVSTLAGQVLGTFFLTEADGARPRPRRVTEAKDALTRSACARSGSGRPMSTPAAADDPRALRRR